jgi:hypothetical protein
VTPAETTTRAARVNKVLPHTVEQVRLLHFLLDQLRGDVAFTATVDAFLDNREMIARRRAELTS